MKSSSLFELSYLPGESWRPVRSEMSLFETKCDRRLMPLSSGLFRWVRLFLSGTWGTDKLCRMLIVELLEFSGEELELLDSFEDGSTVYLIFRGTATSDDGLDWFGMGSLLFDYSESLSDVISCAFRLSLSF